MNRIQDYSEKFSILVVEDNQGDFVLIEDYLYEKFKHIHVIHHTHFASSIDFLQYNKEDISIILLDLHLPDLKGIELINSFLNYNFRIPIIILTGYSDLDMTKKSLQIGIYDYLIKDEINPIILHKTITFALNRSSFINQIEDEKLNYENLFNFNPQPTWLLDSQSLKIINANIAAQKKYGYTISDFLEMSFFQLHPQEELHCIQQKLTSEGDDLNNNQFTHFLNDGKIIKVNLYHRSITIDTKEVIILQSNDISETLNYIDTIETQNLKLRNISWTQSHILRTPISRILGIINLLEDQKEDLDEILFWLKQLRVSTNEMDEIVKNIVEETKQIQDK